MKAYPAYQESGIPWLGKIPGHWAARKIKTLFRIKKEIAGKEGLNVLSITQQGIKIKDIESNEGQIAQSYTNYQLLEVGEFAMNHMDLLTGWVDISPFNGVTSPDYRVFVRSEENASSQYLLYALQTCYSRKLFYGLAQGVSSIGRCRLQTSKFKNFVLPFPPVEEQWAIVAYLDKKCAEIEKLISQRMSIIELLKELKQSMIAKAVTKGLHPDVPMKDSGIPWLGMIPGHWKIERLQWHLKEVKETNSPIRTNQVLSLTNKKGVIPYEEKGNQGNKAKESYDEYKLAYPETIVINSMNVIIGSVGICHYFGCVSPVYYIYTTIGESVLPYINYIFQTALFQKELRRYAKGILEIRLRLSSSDILKRLIPQPPVQEQKNIVAYLDKKCAGIDELISRHEQTIEKLKELRTSIIANVVTGKVDVRDSIHP